MFSNKKNIFKRSLYLIVVPALIVIFASYTFCNHEDKEEVLLKLVTHTLNLYHFSPKDLDDNFSQQLFGFYLKNLDILYKRRYKQAGSL